MLAVFDGPGGRSARICLAIAMLFVACSKADKDKKTPGPQPDPKVTVPTPTPPPEKPAPEWYRAEIGGKQGTAIPFFIQIPSTGDDAFVANGPDRVKAKLVSRPPKAVIEFDILHTKIEATADDKGNLDGTWASSAKAFDAHWSNASLSFHAEPVAGPDPTLRLPGSPGTVDPVGVWKVGLTDPKESGKLTISRGVGNEITATFAFSTGNIAFLAGNQDGKTIRLSAFEGASPYLLVADLDDAGKTFTGRFIAGQALDWKEDLHATKTGDFVLQVQTHLTAKRPKLKVPELEQAPYKGNPVIVELGGSWCPACGNASVKLRELKEKYAKDGLQVLTFAYEFSDDHDYNVAQAAQFKSKYGITWDVIPIDGGLEKYLEILPKELDAIDASGFPLTLFVARDGGIEGFHNGFPPEKWGELHQKAVDDYDRMTAKIVGTAKEK
jgi:thiol-disulfide isomerase/thioredoxin